MKILILLSLMFTSVYATGTLSRAETVKMPSSKSPTGKWSCPARSKFSKIGYDEPFCKIGDKLIQVPGINIPKGYGCFRCVPKSPYAKPLLMNQ